MQIKKGTSRVVIAFLSLGIVIKIAIIKFIEAIKHIPFDNVRSFRKYFMYSVNIRPYFRWYLFGGLYENWNEFWFYLKTKNPFLQPTYFSFFGLINVQKHNQPCQIEILDLWGQFLYLTNKKVWNDNHHFGSSRNFCFNNGQIKMLDYGSPKCQRIIAKYGEKIVASFDPEYKFNPESTL